MPSESDIKKAKPVVDSLIADDLYVMNKKMKPPAAVAAKFRSLAEKADTEVGKFLLLQAYSAFMRAKACTMKPAMRLRT